MADDAEKRKPLKLGTLFIFDKRGKAPKKRFSILTNLGEIEYYEHQEDHIVLETEGVLAGVEDCGLDVNVGLKKFPWSWTMTLSSGDEVTVAAESEEDQKNWITAILSLRPISKIVELLEDRDLWIYAVYSLSNISIGKDNDSKVKIVQEGAVPKFVDFLEVSTDEALRRSICFTLSKIAAVPENRSEIGKKSIKSLKPYLADPDLFVARPIVEIVIECARQSSMRSKIRHAGILEVLLRMAVDSAIDHSLRVLCITALETCLPDDKCRAEVGKCVDELAESINSIVTPPPVRTSLVQMFQTFSNAGELRACVSSLPANELLGGSGPLQALFLRSLKEFATTLREGPDAILSPLLGLLISFLENKSFVEVFARMGGGWSSTFEKLMSSTAYDVLSPTFTLLTALAKIKVNLLTSTSLDTLVPLLRSSNPDVCHDALVLISAISSIGRDTGRIMLAQYVPLLHTLVAGLRRPLYTSTAHGTHTLLFWISLTLKLLDAICASNPAIKVEMTRNINGGTGIEELVILLHAQKIVLRDIALAVLQKCSTKGYTRQLLRRYNTLPVLTELLSSPEPHMKRRAAAVLAAYFYDDTTTLNAGPHHVSQIVAAVSDPKMPLPALVQCLEIVGSVARQQPVLLVGSGCMHRLMVVLVQAKAIPMVRDRATRALYCSVRHAALLAELAQLATPAVLPSLVAVAIDLDADGATTLGNLLGCITVLAPTNSEEAKSAGLFPFLVRILEGESELYQTEGVSAAALRTMVAYSNSSAVCSHFGRLGIFPLLFVLLANDNEQTKTNAADLLQKSLQVPENLDEFLAEQDQGSVGEELECPGLALLCLHIEIERNPVVARSLLGALSTCAKDSRLRSRLRSLGVESVLPYLEGGDPNCRAHAAAIVVNASKTGDHAGGILDVADPAAILSLMEAIVTDSTATLTLASDLQLEVEEDSQTLRLMLKNGGKPQPILTFSFESADQALLVGARAMAQSLVPEKEEVQDPEECDDASAREVLPVERDKGSQRAEKRKEKAGKQDKRSMEQKDKKKRIRSNKERCDKIGEREKIPEKEKRDRSRRERKALKKGGNSLTRAKSVDEDRTEERKIRTPESPEPSSSPRFESRSSMSGPTPKEKIKDAVSAWMGDAKEEPKAKHKKVFRPAAMKIIGGGRSDRQRGAGNSEGDKGDVREDVDGVDQLLVDGATRKRGASSSTKVQAKAKEKEELVHASSEDVEQAEAESESGVPPPSSSAHTQTVESVVDANARWQAGEPLPDTAPVWWKQLWAYRNERVEAVPTDRESAESAENRAATTITPICRPPSYGQASAFLQYRCVTNPKLEPLQLSVLAHFAENGVIPDDPLTWPGTGGGSSIKSSSHIKSGGDELVNRWGLAGSLLEVGPATAQHSGGGWGVGCAVGEMPLLHTVSFPYYEVLVLSKQKELGSMGVGLTWGSPSEDPDDSHPLNVHPGFHRGSVGWRGDGCKYVRGGTARFGPAALWQRGDVIGCGFNNATGEVFFTRNGIFVGVVTSLSAPDIGSGVRPIVSLAMEGDCLRANFGENLFLWNFSFAAPSRKDKGDGSLVLPKGDLSAYLDTQLSLIPWLHYRGACEGRLRRRRPISLSPFKRIGRVLPGGAAAEMPQRVPAGEQAVEADGRQQRGDRGQPEKGCCSLCGRETTIVYQCSICAYYHVCLRCFHTASHSADHLFIAIRNPRLATASTRFCPAEYLPEPEGGAGAVHKGTRCNRCSASPIVGTRFLKLCESGDEYGAYDLCNQCHSGLPTAFDYANFLRIPQALANELEKV